MKTNMEDLLITLEYRTIFGNERFNTFFVTFLHMSLLCMYETQYLQGQKNASNYDEGKFKHVVSRPVSAFLQNEIPLVPQCPFMDLNALKGRGKTGAIFSLDHKVTPALLFSNFDLTIQDMLSMPKLDFIIETQKFPAMIGKEQLQRKQPL